MCMRKFLIWTRARLSYGAVSSLCDSLSIDRPLQTGTDKTGTMSSARKPGQSGNPGRRPKIMAQIRDLARDHGTQAIERLVALMHSKDESVAVRAAEALLHRGHGRPIQGIGAQ
jgi:hypothetical protein